MAIVLLVDPSQTVQRVVEMVFKGSGHDVVAATTATEGQQALVRYQPSVAIVNYRLPDGSGLELCKLIKANPPTSHIPVVVMGGGYGPFDPEQAKASGAATVVMKPFKTAELYEPVAGLIDGVEAAAAAPSPSAAPAQPAAAAQPAAPAQAAAVPRASVASPSGPVAIPRPRPTDERPRYAPPSQSAPAVPPRPAPAAVPRPAPPPAPQAPPPPAPSAAYRGQPERAPVDAEQEDPTRRVSRAMVTAAPPARVDQEAVRAAVEDLLPQIALDTLQKMLADWLEARLRNYIHELVRQELSRYNRQ